MGTTVDIVRPQIISQEISTRLPQEQRALESRQTTTTPTRTNPAENEIDSMTFLRCGVDALVRGVFRTIETHIENPMTRIFYRGGTESIRKIGEGIIEKGKLDTPVCSTGLLRAAENTIASVFFEPNQCGENKFLRVLTGLLNMGVRWGARLSTFALGLINYKEVGLDNFGDDGLARSLGRVISTSSDNFGVGVFARTVEQLAINSSLHIFKPVKRVTALLNKEEQTKGAADLQYAQAV